MYAVAFDKTGFHKCGNDGLQRLHATSRRGIETELTMLRRNNAGGNVYVVHDFTQRMCEMPPEELHIYCQNHYIMMF